MSIQKCSLCSAAPVFFHPLSLDPSASEQWKEVFYLCDPSPLALYDACDHPTAAGVIISILWFTKGEIWQNKEHKWNLGLFCWIHVVWKPQKRSFSKLRAKRATFTFWVDKSYSKMAKMVHFGEFLKTWSLRSNSVTRQVSFRTKIGGKCQN